MISFEREIGDASARQLLPSQIAPRLAGAERREPFSIYVELRLAAWIAVMMIAAGVGLVVRNNLQRIGPLAIALVIGAAAASLLAWSAWRRKSGRVTMIDEYLVLLAALLISADVAFIETQFTIFGPQWHRHLLLISVIHAVIAYACDARPVLSLSIVAFAAWMGVQQNVTVLAGMDALDFCLRALACGAVMLLWREVDRRNRVSRSFEPLFEHFAANFGFLAAMSLLADDDWRLIGVALALLLAGLMLRYAFRARREAFAIYAFVYGVIALDVLVLEVLDDGALGLMFVVLSTIAAIVGLFMIHARFRAEGEE